MVMGWSVVPLSSRIRIPPAYLPGAILIVVPGVAVETASMSSFRDDTMASFAHATVDKRKRHELTAMKEFRMIMA
jgi:hypothetical protein